MGDVEPRLRESWMSVNGSRTAMRRGSSSSATPSGIRKVDLRNRKQVNAPEFRKETEEDAGQAELF